MGATPQHDVTRVEALLERYRERGPEAPRDWNTCKLVLAMELKQAGYERQEAHTKAAELVAQLQQHSKTAQYYLPPQVMMTREPLVTHAKPSLARRLPQHTADALKIESAPLSAEAIADRDSAAIQARIKVLQAANSTLARTLLRLDTNGLYAHAAPIYRREMTDSLCGKLRFAGATEAEIPVLLEAIVQQLHVNADNPAARAEGMLSFLAGANQNHQGRH